MTTRAPRCEIIHLGGVSRDQRAAVVGVAGEERTTRDAAADPEDVAELARPAKDELDLALGKAQDLSNSGSGTSGAAGASPPRPLRGTIGEAVPRR